MLALTMTWPGGEHPFRLALAQLEGLQQKTDAGPEWLLFRLQSGQWLATEIFETLRFGLIGGGMGDSEAARLVGNALDRHPLISFKVPALQVLTAALYGPLDDMPGKQTLASEETPETTPEES
ncbi:gene transfer agent family protein [Paracoccus suum]|uniref:Gene transfer agent family protein n=1 Tax=Paracoccus suum TaxID=2259340 RepID=A0A344PL12_9RHOB|nr:gene transfer agent family protein [Paracoccus suum]AXC50067.1 gene transfer agent family protein [Paracoccus suum]